VNKPKVAACVTYVALVGSLTGFAYTHPRPAEPSPMFQHCTTTDPAHPDRELTASCQVGSVQNPIQEATNVPRH